MLMSGSIVFYQSTVDYATNIERTWWWCMPSAMYDSNNQIVIITDDNAWKLQRTTGLLGTSGY
jgi:hypothetical protein